MTRTKKYPAMDFITIWDWSDIGIGISFYVTQRISGYRFGFSLHFLFFSIIIFFIKNTPD